MTSAIELPGLSRSPQGRDLIAPGEIQAYRHRRRSVFYPKTDSPLGDDALRALRDRGPDAVGTRHAAEACRMAMGTAPATVVPLDHQGTFHRLFRATIPGRRPVIVRFHAVPGPERDYSLLADLWASRRLRPVGLPVPPVHLVDLSRRVIPLDFEVLDQAPGHCLHDLDHDDDAIRSALRGLGRAVARLHSVSVPGAGWIDTTAMLDPTADPARGFGLFDSWRGYITLNLKEHVAACLAIGAITNDEARRVVGAFDDAADLLDRVEPRLLHGDLGNHNVFIDDGEISALIDWEDCLAGDPFYDVAFWATFHPDRRHGAFLDGYATVAPMPDDFDRRFWLYYLRVALSKTVHRHRFGYADKPGRPPAADRIRKALGQVEAL